MTQNVARTKLAQYLTLVKVSSNSIGWLMRKSTNKIGWKEKKKNRRNTVGDYGDMIYNVFSQNGA